MMASILMKQALPYSISTMMKNGNLTHLLLPPLLPVMVQIEQVDKGFSFPLMVVEPRSLVHKVKTVESTSMHIVDLLFGCKAEKPSS